MLINLMLLCRAINIQTLLPQKGFLFDCRPSRNYIIVNCALVSRVTTKSLRPIMCGLILLNFKNSVVFVGAAKNV